MGRVHGSIAAGSFHTCAVDDVGEMQCWGKNMDYQGPRNIRYNDWVSTKRILADREYATAPFPGTCEKLLKTRIDFKTRVNGCSPTFNLSVTSTLFTSFLLLIIALKL